MTKDEIQKIPAGRETDALVYAKIFGGMAFKSDGHFLDAGDAYYLGENQETIRLPEYSTDIAAAWELVEKLHGFSINRHYKYWICYFNGNDPVQAETAPLAICRAALLEVGGGE